MDIENRLDRLEKKIDLLIELLRPVNAHASFVDDLKTACKTNRLLKTVITVSEDHPPPLKIEDEPTILLDCVEESDN